MSKKNNQWDHKNWKNYFKQQGGITVGEINQMLKKLKEKDFFFTSSIEIISRHFLSKVFNENVFVKSFEEILKLSVSLIDNDELLQEFPDTENEFYRHIAKEYLWLSDTPRDKMITLYLEASEDLKTITSNLEKIDEQIKVANNFGSRGEEYITSEYKHEIDRLNYYKRKNTDAQQTIIAFLINDIKTFSYNECYVFNKLLGPFLRSTPYSFSRRNPFFARRTRESYDPDSFSFLENKFLYLNIREYDELISKHRNGVLKEDEILSYSKKYIENRSLIFDFQIFIKRNHILQNRSEILNKIIDRYNNGDYISVCYMVPPQIEGIFTDYCIEMDIPNKEIHKSSISAKIGKLLAKSNLNISYDYFACYFPVIRNRLAHGVKLNDDFEFLATMLMLDMFSVCNMAFSEEFNVNKSIKLISDIFQHRFPEDIYLWIDYLDVELPPMYQLEEKIIEIKKLYESDEFWDYISKKIVKEEIDDVEEKIIKLKKGYIASERCDENLKKLIK